MSMNVITVKDAEQMKTTIHAGIMTGIADAEAGRATELDATFVADMQAELTARLLAKKG